MSAAVRKSFLDLVGRVAVGGKGPGPLRFARSDPKRRSSHSLKSYEVGSAPMSHESGVLGTRRTSPSRPRTSVEPRARSTVPA